MDIVKYKPKGILFIEGMHSLCILAKVHTLMLHPYFI